MSYPSSAITCTTRGFRVPGSSPALSAANFSPPISLRKVSAIWLRALLWMQINSTFFLLLMSTPLPFGVIWLFKGNPFVNCPAGKTTLPVILQSCDIPRIDLIRAACTQQNLLHQTALGGVFTGNLIMGPLGVFITGEEAGRVEAVQLPRGIALL